MSDTNFRDDDGPLPSYPLSQRVVDGYETSWWQDVNNFVYRQWIFVQVDPTGATDSTAAIQQALIAATDTGDLITGVAVRSVILPPGNIKVSNLILPPATKLKGQGRLLTNLMIAAGTAGQAITDNGNAAKICVEGIAVYGQSEPALTHGIRLGYNGVQHGVEGWVRDVWIRNIDGAAGVCGFDVNGNVGFYDLIASYDSPIPIRITGIANEASKVVSYGATQIGADFNLCNVKGLEIEAPATGSIPLYMRGNSQIVGFVFSPANGTVFDCVGEFNANCTTWSIQQFTLGGGNCTITNQNFKRSDGTYFGGNAGGGSFASEESSFDSEYYGQIQQSFALTIFNNAGTIQHKITDMSANVASGSVKRINGASAAFVNTPIGADNVTAMVNGGKIGSANTNRFWFDVPPQRQASFQGDATMQFNSSTVALSVTKGFESININGVVRTRFFVQVNNAATGAAFNLTTLAVGAIVQFACNPRLS